LHTKLEYSYSRVDSRSEKEQAYADEIGELIGYYFREDEDEHSLAVTGYMYDSLGNMWWHFNLCQPYQCGAGKTGNCTLVEIDD
jgi:hypothetical protein